MKITKKAFVDTLTSNPTTFCGFTKRLYTSDEVYCAIRNLLQPDVILEQRSCKARSRDLVFCNGSHLDFMQGAKHDFYEYAYPEGKVYVYCYTWIDEWDNTMQSKALYYLIKN
jgi:hypothetical protein